MATFVPVFVLISVVALPQMTAALTCDCTSSIGTAKQALDTQSRQQQRSIIELALNRGQQQPVIKFTTSSCINNQTTCTASGYAPNMKPFCLSYNGPFAAPFDNSTFSWNDCVALDPSILDSNKCFSTPQKSKNMCVCDAWNNCKVSVGSGAEMNQASTTVGAIAKSLLVSLCALYIMH